LLPNSSFIIYTKEHGNLFHQDFLENF